MENICLFCNKKFEWVSGKGKFCSLECYHNSMRRRYDDIKNRACKQCGKDFISSQKSKKQILLNNFCNRKCRYLYQSIIQKTGIIKKCKQCNKEFYTKKCHDIYAFCNKKCWYKYRKGKYNPNHSIARAKLVAEGKINPKRNYYKQGWILNNTTNENEYFASSYEEKRMQQLNKISIKWTKKHGIRIPYKDETGNIRNYVPDILVNDNILEEIKPKTLVNSRFDNNLYKNIAAVEYCKQNGLEYKVITEKELEIWF